MTIRRKPFQNRENPLVLFDIDWWLVYNILIYNLGQKDSRRRHACSVENVVKNYEQQIYSAVDAENRQETRKRVKRLSFQNHPRTWSGT
jgi:hypothetical protein